MANLTLLDALLQQRGQVGDPWPGLSGPQSTQPGGQSEVE